MNLFIRLLYALSPMLVLTNIECFAGQATSNGGENLSNCESRSKELIPCPKHFQ